MCPVAQPVINPKIARHSAFYREQAARSATQITADLRYNAITVELAGQKQKMMEVLGHGS